MTMTPKSELALSYFPTCHDAHTAVKNLMRMVTYCRPLHRALLDTGYQKSQRFFTPKQVALIYDYLGEP